MASFTDVHRAHAVHLPLADAYWGVGLKRDRGDASTLVCLLVAVERPWQTDKQVFAEAGRELQPLCRDGHLIEGRLARLGETSGPLWTFWLLLNAPCLLIDEGDVISLPLV